MKRMNRLLRYFANALLMTIIGVCATTSSFAQLVINEIHADPASDITGDANGDGTRSASDDEFIEFFNAGSLPLDISGWSIFDTNSALLLRHVFPSGTIIPAGGVLVVFGGGTPVGTFGGAIVQVASTGALGITNTSETLIVEDDLSNPMISYTFGSEADDNQSISRDPEVTGTDNPMVKHSLISNAVGLFSPGTKSDGSDFGGIMINEIHADPASDITGDANGDGTRNASDDEFIEFVNTGLVEIDLSGWILSDTFSTPIVRHIFPPSTTLDVGEVLVLFGGGTPTGAFGGSRIQVASEGGGLALTNGGDVIVVVNTVGDTLLFQAYGGEGDNNQSITRDPDITGSDNPMTLHTLASGSGSRLFSPGTRVDGSNFNNAFNFIINEIHADPASDITGDANGDGIRSASEDEFVEFVNGGSTDLDISGWVVSDTFSVPTVRHIFPNNTIVSPGGAIVVFGGGTPTGSFGNSLVQIASEGSGLALTNGVEGVVVTNAVGDTIIYYTYGSEGDNNQSIVRDPDISGAENPMVLHSTASGSGGRLFSPGTKIDGSPFLDVANTQVQFSVASISASEGDGTIQLEVTIAGEDVSNATTVDIVLISGAATDLGNFNTVTVTFPAGSSTSQMVSVMLSDDDEVESEEVFVFELQNVSGGSAAEIGGQASIQLVLTDNDLASSSLVINEFMAWPAGSDGSANGPVVDSNGDGVASFEEDEFIEFVNNGNTDIDISGWQIYDEFSQVLLRHEFPSGTIINPGGALVVFGGGNPTGDFGGAQVQISSTLNLGLTNTNDAIIVRNNIGENIIYLPYGSQTRGTSITLNPDITGAIGPHPNLNGVNISPGTKVDGSSFEIPSRTTIQFASSSGGVSEAGESFQIALSITRPSDTEPTTAEVIISSSGYESDITYTTSLVTFPAGSLTNQTVEVTVVNDDLAEGDELFVFAIQNVSGGTTAGLGNITTFEFSLLDDDVPLIFNEIHADPAPGLAGDANNDGIRDAVTDEFIEVVNQSEEDIDMSGWEFSDAEMGRHIFLSGTILSPGKALIVFGGGIPIGQFGGSEFQLASQGSGLSLDDSGDTLYIRDNLGVLKAGTVYGNLANTDQSIARSPDITGGMTKHTTIISAAGKLYSPGMKSNGFPFTNLVTASPEGVNNKLKVFPNPVKSELVYDRRGYAEQSTMMFMDSKGIMILSEDFEGSTLSLIEVDDLAAGIYYYQIKNSKSGLVLGSGKMMVIK